MARLRAGEDLALNEIMARWQGRVTGFLLRMIANESMAVELAQETFVRVYQQRDRYRPTGKFSTWLFTIAANLARHHDRWRRRHPAVSLQEEERTIEWLAAEGAAPDQAEESRERSEAVRRAIAMLPDDLRESLVLFEYEDLSHREIAAIAGCSPKAVENRLHRARTQLREKLRAYLEK